MNYTIYITYHRDDLLQQYALREDTHHRLFATHRAPTVLAGFASEKNINHLNPVYSEMVTMWYVWQNGLRSEYVGFEHYRRHLTVRDMPRKDECQVFRVMDFGTETLRDQYARCHNVADLDIILSLLNDRYGNGNAYAAHILHSTRLIANCTFLMAWSDFVALCEYLFPLLADFGKACGITPDGLGTVDKWTAKAVADFGGDKTAYQRRVVSFLAERLISAWISTHLHIYNGITAATVHYNTPELTAYAIRSLWKHSPGTRVIVFDNSDCATFNPAAIALSSSVAVASSPETAATAAVPAASPAGSVPAASPAGSVPAASPAGSVPVVSPAGSIEVIDNTRSQLIDFDKMLSHYPHRELSDRNKSNFGSAKHSRSVDMLMDFLPDGFLLMDSDVLFKRDITPLIDRTKAAVGQSQYKEGVTLLQPFLCWLNVPMLRENGIRYFNGDHIWALTPGNRWDTGAWLMNGITSHRLPWRQEDIWQYIVHLGHASWRSKPFTQWLQQHRQLWE